MNNKNKEKQPHNNKIPDKTKPLYIFAFRCKACNKKLNHSNNSFKEQSKGVFVENDLCPECSNASYDCSYAHQFDHELISEGLSVFSSYEDS